MVRQMIELLELQEGGGWGVRGGISWPKKCIPPTSIGNWQVLGIVTSWFGPLLHGLLSTSGRRSFGLSSQKWSSSLHCFPNLSESINNFAISTFFSPGSSHQSKQPTSSQGIFMICCCFCVSCFCFYSYSYIGVTFIAGRKGFEFHLSLLCWDWGLHIISDQAKYSI